MNTALLRIVNIRAVGYIWQMLNKIAIIWNSLFAPKDWEPIGDVASCHWQMHRWRNGQWEIRDASSSEAREASIWQANR